MKYKIAVLEIFIFVAAYLILSIPAALATEVNVMYGGSSTPYHPEFDQRDRVSITKTINDDRVTINITNSTDEYDIENLYLFRCRDKNPEQCASLITPDTEANIIYDWDEVSSSDIANLMFLVRLDDTTEGANFFPYVGFWHTIEKSGSSYTQTEYSLDSMEAHVALYEDRSPVNEWVTSKLCIPFNLLGDQYTVFSGAERIYGVESTDFSSFQSETTEDNSIASINKKVYFAFPESPDGKIMNPITLYSNAPSDCGNGACETVLGETSSNCCYDCGCSSGQYCDTGGGTEGMCKPESIIELEITDIDQLLFSDCNSEHEIGLTARIKNAPSGMKISSKDYKLDDDSYHMLTCENLDNHYYSCSMTVPQFPFGDMPNCGTGTYTIEQNKIKFGIEYYDGSDTATRILYADVDDIVVGSYTCGNNICETALGETSSNCCYDCACPEGQHCDTNSPVSGENFCRNEPENDDFEITRIEPSEFSPGTGTTFSESFVFTYQIENAPSTLVVLQSSSECDMECKSYNTDGSNEQTCSVTCESSCDDGSVTDGVYESECSTEFEIPEPGTSPDYDQTKSYILKPELSITVKYGDGNRGLIEKELNVKGGGISIGYGYCGDGECSPEINENSKTCCFDCGCEEEDYYCDTEYRSGARGLQKDTCRDDSTMALEIANMNPDPPSFEDHTKENILRFDAHIKNPPKSMEYEYSCEFGDGSDIIDCDMSCEDKESEVAGEHNMSCTITIDPVGDDYKSSKFYNPETQLLTLPPVLGFSLEYNDGAEAASKELTKLLDSIKIIINYHCGIDGCEEDLGETPENCCRDCGCPVEENEEKQYCYYNKDDVADYGECKKESDISLVIDSIAPDPATCCIDNYMSDCLFVTVNGECAGLNTMSWGSWSGELSVTNSIELKAHVENPPPTLESLSYRDYHMTLNGKEQEGFGGVHCYPDTSEGLGHYECKFNLKPINDHTEGTEPRNVELFFSVGYDIGEERRAQNLSATDSFTIERKKTNILKDKEDEISDIEDKISRIKGIKAIAYAVLIAGAAYCACTCWCCCPSPACGHCLGMDCVTCWILYACLASVILGALSFVEGKITDLEAKKDQLNTEIGKSSDVPEMGGLMENMGTKMTAAAAGLICALGAPHIGSAEATALTQTSVGMGVSFRGGHYLDYLFPGEITSPRPKPSWMPGTA